METKHLKIPALSAEIIERVRDGGASESDIIHVIEEWAILRCKETALNVRHKACEAYYDVDNPRDPDQVIMNIPFKDVSPF